MRLKHGGELRAFSEKFAVPEKSILDFSSNINPLGPPPSVEKSFESSGAEIRFYPDPEALELRREVARHFPLWPENVVVGNGAVEILDLVLRFLHPKKALLIEPGFLEYRRLLNVMGTEIRSVLLKEKDSFQLSLAELVNALQGVEVAVLAQPNNPTGTLMEKESVQKFLQEAKRRNVFVVIDEAFIDWIPEYSMGRELRDDSHFFVVRSLTKFYSIPGIRIGYGLGSRKLIERLSTYQIPWSCNRIAQKLGVIAIRDESFASHSRQWLAEERNWFFSRLKEFPGLKVYPSAANFFLLKGPVSLFDELGKQGIYIRDLTESPGLGSSYYRLSIRERKDNEKLLIALSHSKMMPVTVSI